MIESYLILSHAQSAKLIYWKKPCQKWFTLQIIVDDLEVPAKFLLQYRPQKLFSYSIDLQVTLF